MQTTVQKLKARLGAGDVADAIAAASDAVNAAAERVRWTYVSPGHQSSVYQNKAAEADACQAVVDAAGTPVADDYPYLKAEVGINGVAVAAVAAAVIAKRDLWLGIIDPAIEGMRQALQKQLEDLDTAVAANTPVARQTAADAQRDIEAAVATALGT
tara:strand:- start:45338 stop:45808 length:471 start_codon:yes stop_codon:yes gene_type:complete